MATLTAAAATPGAQPKTAHVGVQAVTGTVSLTASPSAGDLIRMAKIPTGARILAIQRNFAAGTGNDFVGNIGFEIPGLASLSAFGSATGAAGIAMLTKGLPQDISCSDDAATQFGYVSVSTPTVTSASATGSLSLTIFFTMDRT